MIYPGGKSSSGVFQYIINQIPPHRVYIETHLGGGAVLRNKKLADINIAVDIADSVINQWSGQSDVTLISGDAVEYLSNYNFDGNEFVYVDPPYLMSTRRSRRKLYKNEYNERQHIDLLNVLIALDCNIMVSGYWSELYNTKLSDWRRLEYKSRMHSGAASVEYLWMNYPEAQELHDYQYLGGTYRERERIRRRNSRWKTKLNKLPLLEKKALLEQLVME